MSIETDEYQCNLDKLQNNLYEQYTREHVKDIIQQLDELIENQPELITEVVRTGVKVYASKST